MSEIQAIEPPPAYQSGSSGTVKTPPEPYSPDPTFELLLTILHPPKRVRTSNRKTKTAKTESANKGPYDISIKTEWDAFLGTLAEKLSVECSDLVVSTLEWRWVKPASSLWLPLQDEGGFASMIKKVKSKPDAYIIVRMNAPVKKKAANVWDSVDELESDIEDKTNSKKPRLDDTLDEIVEQLSDKYSPGLCRSHPDLSCLHHRATDLHFNLDRPRLLVWAQAIKAGTASYEKVPITSPMFKRQLALKRASNNADTATTVAAATSSSIPATATPNMAFTQMPTPTMSMPQYSPMFFPQAYPQMPPFMGYGAHGMSFPSGNPFFPADSGMVSMPTRSPPSSPPTANCTITQFCETYALGKPTEVGLEKLGFRFGDDLTTVTSEEYMGAGFKLLEWRRVLTAYRKLKHDTWHR